MQKTIVFATLFLITIIFAQAQSEKTYKVYLNGNFRSNTTTQTTSGVTVTNDLTSGTFRGFSPAVNKTKENGRYTELELSNFNIGRSQNSQTFVDSTGNEQYLSGADSYSFSTSFRYESGFNIRAVNGASTEKFSYSLGVALQPYLGFTSRAPFTSNDFRFRNFNIGTKFQLVPRLIFGGKKNLSVDINFPINLAEASISNTRRSDPALPIERQIITQTNFRFLPFDIQARIGVGLRI